VPDQGKIKKKLDYKTSQEMETFSCAREFEELKAARTIIDQANGPPVSRNLLTLGLGTYTMRISSHKWSNGLLHYGQL
jgi:hypothetical protein